MLSFININHFWNHCFDSVGSTNVLSGSGIGPTIQIGEETVITVDAKAAGKGKVTCKVSTPDGAELDVDVVENADGTFDIYYTAPEPGKYVITIRFGGEHIPNSPFHVVVSRHPENTMIWAWLISVWDWVGVRWVG